MIQVYDDRTSTSYKVYNDDEINEMISSTINFYKDQYERIKNENVKLRVSAIQTVKEEYEKEIQNLKEKLSMSYGEFASIKEKVAYNNFVNKHEHCREDMKINAGKMPYLMPTGTGIGTVLRVVCPICYESEDITDTGAW